MPTTSTSDPNIPQNLEAERALLGSILLENESLAIVLKTLVVNDFFSESHRLTFRAMMTLAEQRRPIELVSLSESLDRSGLLEKAGGAAYLAALTDGVPIGTSQALPEYIRIVKEKAIVRRVIQTANNMITYALNGGSNEASVLLDLAQAQINEIQASYIAPEIEVVTPQEDKEKAKKDRYPHIRRDAWHPAAEIYRQAVANSSEASDNWHFISFYTTIGALLGDTVFGQMGSRFYPQLYSVLVGMIGGDGKTTSTNFCFDFAKMVDDSIYVPRTIDSKAGFIKAWATHNQQNGVKTNTRAILRLGELRSLLDVAAQTGTHSIISLLNDAYDGETLQNESVATPYMVERPRLAAIFASAYKNIRPMKDEDLETGFGRRLCFCPGDPKGPMPYPDPPNQEILTNLAGQIKDMLMYWKLRETHRLEPSPQVRKLWISWYKKYKQRLKDDDLIAAMSIGDRVTVQKICLINAALDKADKFFEPWHLEPALEFGEYLYESRFPLFAEHGASPDLDIDKKILAKIPEFPGRIIRRSLQQKCHLDARTFNRHLDDLSIDGGEVIKRKEGTRWWVWKTKL